jgi:hypothetical protein
MQQTCTSKFYSSNVPLLLPAKPADRPVIPLRSAFHRISITFPQTVLQASIITSLSAKTLMHINGQYKTRSNGNSYTRRHPRPPAAGSQCNRTDRHSRLSLRQASWGKTDTSRRITTGVSVPLLPRNTTYRSCARDFLYCPCRTSFSSCNRLNSGRICILLKNHALRSSF